MLLLNRLKLNSFNSKRNYYRKLILSDKVKSAKANNVPIVALESAIITHGLPVNANHETAVAMEKAIEAKGAVAATIAVLNGKIHVGLSPDELEILSKEVRTVKCGQRDICTLIADGLTGGTTVGGTLAIAHLAGIQIMATGGIGGVHRDVDKTFDISSDLIVLSQTPLALVSAGIKPILDVAKTLEYLETLGVPVMSLVPEDAQQLEENIEMFPAFYSRFSDRIKTPARVGDAKAAAACFNTQRVLGFQSAVLFAVPIPKESAIPSEEIEQYIDEALKGLHGSIQGKHVTPYLLEMLNKLSGRRTVKANTALAINNAKVAAEIAIELSKLTESVGINSKIIKVERISRKREEGSKGPVAIGGATLDTTLQVSDNKVLFDGRTHQGISCNNFGGVGRNVAAALVALGELNTKLLTVVGDDQPGSRIVQNLSNAGLTISKLPNKTTAQYTAVVDQHGKCHFGFGQMDIFQFIDINLMKQHQSTLEQATFIILDGNPPLKTIQWIIELASACEIPIWYEPTDAKKAPKVFQAHTDWKAVHFISPNLKELIAIAKHFSIETSSTFAHQIDILEVKTIAEQVAREVPVVITTLGSEGVYVTRRASEQSPFYSENSKYILKEDSPIQSRLYPPLMKIDGKISESGCGDCLAAGVISGLLKRLDEKSCINIGLNAANLSLQSSQTVPASLQQLR